MASCHLLGKSSSISVPRKSGARPLGRFTSWLFLRKRQPWLCFGCVKALTTLNWKSSERFRTRPLKGWTSNRAKFFAYQQLTGDQARGRRRTDWPLVPRRLSEFLDFWCQAASRRQSARSPCRGRLLAAGLRRTHHPFSRYSCALTVLPGEAANWSRPLPRPIIIPDVMELWRTPNFSAPQGRSRRAPPVRRGFCF